MSKKEDIITIGCSMFCVSLFVLALNIPLLYYGFEDEDSTCVQGERGGIDLPTWNKIVGMEKVVLTLFLYISLIIASLGGEFMLIGVSIALILDIFWHVIFWIWGVVIISTNENNSCVSDGKGMAVICIIWLVLGEVGFMYQTTLKTILS